MKFRGIPWNFTAKVCEILVKLYLHFCTFAQMIKHFRWNPSCLSVTACVWQWGLVASVFTANCLVVSLYKKLQPLQMESSLWCLVCFFLFYNTFGGRFIRQKDLSFQCILMKYSSSVVFWTTKENWRICRNWKGRRGWNFGGWKYVISENFRHIPVSNTSVQKE